MKNSFYTCVTGPNNHNAAVVAFEIELLWPGNATITTYRPTNGTMKKRHRTLPATCQQEDT